MKGKKGLLFVGCMISFAISSLALLSACGESEGIVTDNVPHEHTLEYHEAQAATCTEDGNSEYWSCKGCEHNFSDSQGTNELSSVAVQALGHKLEHHGSIAATCTENGNLEYWSCTRCEHNFSDSQGTNELSSVVIQALGHKLEHHGSLAATCTEDGNLEYWSCTRCDLNYADSQGNKKLDSVVSKALGHSFDEAYHYNTNKHWQVCKRCGELSEKVDHVYSGTSGKCSVCGYTQETQPLTYTLEVSGAKTAFTESDTVFTVGNQFIVRAKYVSDNSGEETKLISSSNYTVDHSAVDAALALVAQKKYSLARGTYEVTVTATVDGVTQTATYSVTVDHAWNSFKTQCTACGATQDSYQVSDTVLCSDWGSEVSYVASDAVFGKVPSDESYLSYGSIGIGQKIVIKGKGQVSFDASTFYYIPITGIRNGSNGVVIRNDNWIIDVGPGGTFSWPNHSSGANATYGIPTDWTNIDEWEIYQIGTLCSASDWENECDLEMSWEYREDGIVVLSISNLTAEKTITYYMKVPTASYECVLYGERFNYTVTNVSYVKLVLDESSAGGNEGSTGGQGSTGSQNPTGVKEFTANNVTYTVDDFKSQSLSNDDTSVDWWDGATSKFPVSGDFAVQFTWKNTRDIAWYADCVLELVYRSYFYADQGFMQGATSWGALFVGDTDNGIEAPSHTSTWTKNGEILSEAPANGTAGDIYGGTYTLTALRKGSTLVVICDLVTDDGVVYQSVDVYEGFTTAELTVCLSGNPYWVDEIEAEIGTVTTAVSTSAEE